MWSPRESNAARGEVRGAEALDTKRRAKKAGERLAWSHRDPEPPPFPFEAVRDGDRSASRVADLTGRVSQDGGERGLLGLAFSPDGTKLYVDYTDRHGGGAVGRRGPGAARAPHAGASE